MAEYAETHFVLLVVVEKVGEFVEEHIELAEEQIELAVDEKVAELVVEHTEFAVVEKVAELVEEHIELAAVEKVAELVELIVVSRSFLLDAQKQASVRCKICYSNLHSSQNYSDCIACKSNYHGTFFVK